MPKPIHFNGFVPLKPEDKLIVGDILVNQTTRISKPVSRNAIVWGYYARSWEPAYEDRWSEGEGWPYRPIARDGRNLIRRLVSSKKEVDQLTLP
jgi:hypothetical protein